MNVESSVTRRRTHASLPNRVDVAVIGSGLGGLVAAAHLARAGMSVAVFEGHYTAGGCATQFARGPKRAQYHFDVGLHYVGDCGEDGQIPRLLREVDVDVKFRPMDQDGFDTLIFPGIEFRVPASVERYRERLVEHFPHERRGIDKYCKLLDAVMTAGRAMDRGGRPSLLQMPALALAGLRLAPHRHATIGSVLDACDIRDMGARAVMLGQSGDYGLPPSKVSAMLHLGLAGHYFRGAYYPEGGGQVIADRLCARIESLGGSIHLRHPIERVIIENGRAVGVRVAARAGEPARDVRADIVLSNADLKKTFLDLVGPEHLPSEYVTRTRDYEMAAALIITFLGLKGGVERLGATNYWAFDTVDTESVYRDLGRHTGEIRTHGCYVTSASRKDPGNALHHAPEGITNVEVMTLVPGSLERFGVDPSVVATWDYKKNERYRTIKKQLEDDMIRRLDALFPGAASHVVFRETATPVSHVRYTNATDGTGYGLAATPEQFLERRPGYRSPIQGLYLCGASTRAGHGIVGAMSSGKNAARRIQKDRATSVSSHATR
ncbi:MAG: phytoene desaturase family protein [Polyangiales bacterium]